MSILKPHEYDIRLTNKL